MVAKALTMLERLIALLAEQDADERSRRIDELAYEAMSYAARQRSAERERLYKATIERTKNWPEEVLTTNVGRWWI